MAAIIYPAPHVEQPCAVAVCCPACKSGELVNYVAGGRDTLYCLACPWFDTVPINPPWYAKDGRHDHATDRAAQTPGRRVA